jgi:hypothetical protein
MDRDEMKNLYRGPSINASYQVSVHLPKRFRRRFKKIAKWVKSGFLMIVPVYAKVHEWSG